ncbi:MAG: hypothetical protein ABFS09_01035 [Thermodesulfobacteriota bacterium]
MHPYHASPAKLQKNLPVKPLSVIQAADYVATLYGYSIGKMDRIIEGEWVIDEWAEIHSQSLNELHLGPEDLYDFKEEILEQLHDEASFGITSCRLAMVLVKYLGALSWRQ